jgi:hypothetical protein
MGGEQAVQIEKTAQQIAPSDCRPDGSAEGPEKEPLSHLALGLAEGRACFDERSEACEGVNE